ncbi:MULTISPECIES: hypothetical protein [unclassified Bradyrhizobium]|uniref:hypothetical protein n=1 Tax=unclassified Bradyrhizobium TaxID=2631580 RepID=UPI001BAC4184|nr:MULTISPECIES: hypothetical protein [unclassified Bradyrhizobium]MBR1206783.1 hypothetical protein [Bradyrhizobium sp. AUGA SZCCT0124]MBR1316777.1 hypothetical protein [Bradyrhizobium sp. AUGA SZCCT0051]MBR1344851.1 hypothetical protein [Bradyrhizobium sp. AUGA SZCCT0105]MBR1356353.1 hypothetical protein [Bradyrhizobium sp. AUGA SZCCT0045]
MQNDLSGLLYYLPILFALPILVLLLRLAWLVISVVIAINRARRFQSQFDVVIRNLPPPGIAPSNVWVSDVSAMAGTWSQLDPIQRANMANKKANMIQAFTAARVPPPPGFP